MTDKLFQPYKLRSLALPNRIVVSPMAQFSADREGRATDWHHVHYGTLAVSGAGLVILEATAVRPEGRVSPCCLGIWDDGQIDGLRKVVDFSRKSRGAFVGIQLAHAGRKGSVSTPWQGGHALSREEGGWPIWSSSNMPYPGREAPLEPDASQLEEITRSYVDSAQRADAAGFDLIELHAAHGYFLNAFLSPLSNGRSDMWGGSLENRMRFPLEVFRRLRDAWPSHKPLGVRISVTDWVDGGWDVASSSVFASRLRAFGCDYVAVSSGGVSPEQKVPVGPGYQVPAAAEVRSQSGIPIMAVGMLSDPELANRVLVEEKADLVAIGRGMLFNPRWAWHAGLALTGDIRIPDPYRRCHPDLRHLPR